MDRDMYRMQKEKKYLTIFHYLTYFQISFFSLIFIFFF